MAVLARRRTKEIKKNISVSKVSETDSKSDGKKGLKETKVPGFPFNSKFVRGLSDAESVPKSGD